jgi:16S rRNA (adenine1518-N6/adenine1519-N6)-dimethyltransferase
LSSRSRGRGIQPRKSLGQNFLTDDTTARRIAAAATLSPSDLAIEIGPGTGALTRHLAGSAGHVVAIELDPALLPVLQQELAGAGADNVTIVHGDALEVDFARLAREAERVHGASFARVCFVANLPYYITSAAIRRILECDLPVACAVVMVQLEVAQRIIARPPGMSLLAVSVQFYGTPELLLRVPAGRFFPPPDVESAVLRIVPHARPAGVDHRLFFRCARAGFGQPRKQLRNTLSAGLGISKAQSATILLASGIDPGRRAESMGIEEWITVAQTVERLRTDLPTEPRETGRDRSGMDAREGRGGAPDDDDDAASARVSD